VVGVSSNVRPRDDQVSVLQRARGHGPRIHPLRIRFLRFAPAAAPPSIRFAPSGSRSCTSVVVCPTHLAVCCAERVAPRRSTRARGTASVLAFCLRRAHVAQPLAQKANPLQPSSLARVVAFLHWRSAGRAPRAVARQQGRIGFVVSARPPPFPRGLTPRSKADPLRQAA
jgi:hypothetical protein